MLHYWKDGERVECQAVYSSGEVGQMVVLDNVGFKSDSENPLAQYQQPYAFIIRERGDDHYVIADADGTSDPIQILFDGVDTWSLFPLKEWLAWRRGHFREKMSRKQRKINGLEAKVALMKEILVKQGNLSALKGMFRSLGIS